MNEVIAQALAESVSKGSMTMEQVPRPYQEAVAAIVGSAPIEQG